jgi:RNA polymerase sigma-70 factor, ECF subfamily
MTEDLRWHQRAALVRLAQAGEVHAFEALARQCGRAVYAIALAHLGRPADAEDVAQAVLLSALEHLEQCRQPERFDAWLLSMARNRSRRALLRNRLWGVLQEAEAIADPTAGGDGADRQRMLRALGTLAARPREVVLLHDLEGYTHAEIARALSMTEEASRQHLSRAHRQLRTLLEEP